MTKVAIVILAENGSHESMGRVANALEFAKELKEENDDVRIIFDGAGVTFVPELADENHDANPLFKAVEDKIDGACKYCSKAFGTINQVRKTDIPLLAEYDNHPSLRKYVTDGYQIVTF